MGARCQKSEGWTLLIAGRATVSDLRPRCTSILSDIGATLEGRNSKFFVAGRVLSNEGHRVFVKCWKLDFFISSAITQAHATQHGGVRVTANPRSEERRVGKECGSTCRSRVLPSH